MCFFFFFGHFPKGKKYDLKTKWKKDQKPNWRNMAFPNPQKTNPQQEFKVMNSSSSLNLLEMKDKSYKF
jgi:hypothetical protein